MKKDHIISLISAVKYKADKFIVSELKRNGIKDLAPSHGEIINALLNHKKLSMKQIAKKIDRDKSTVTTLIKKLINIGYVQKEEDPTDKRVIFISLTKKGEEIRPIFDEISKNLIDHTYSDFTEKEINSIIPLLEKLNKTW